MNLRLKKFLAGSVSLVALAGAAAAQTRDINIPAEDLRTALDDFIRQSGVQLVYNAADVEGARTHGVRGALTPEQALNQLLAGTDVIAKREASGAIGVSRRPERHAANDLQTPIRATAPEPAEAPGSATGTEQVVVTGTSIRGVAPVGSNLISMTSAEIAATGGQTLQQVLLDVPALTGMGAIGQGQTNNSYYQPTIHQIGGSSSNATLVIFDGYRAPAGGTNHSNEIDPNVIPLNMIERIEVLTDGSSSIYGSDAISGVVNFITRKKFDGVQITAQSGFLKGAADLSAGILMGTSSDRSSIMFAWSFTSEGAVSNLSRPWTYPNHTAQAAAAGASGTGTANFLNDNCDPATIQPNASGSSYYVNAQGTAQISSAPTSAICTNWNYADLAPKEIRDDFMLKGSQVLAENLTVTTEIGYATLRDTAAVSRGTLTATAFGAGGQANPFYLDPPGVTVTKQSIRWNGDALLGPGATSTSGTDTAFGNANFEYNIDDNFVVNLLANAGETRSFADTDGTLNSTAALLALNGSTQSGGSTTTVAIPGTGILDTNLPLTTANALDVWDPASGNKTPASVIAALEDNPNRQVYDFGFQQYRVSTNGDLFSLPAGPLKAAFGAEYYRTQLTEFASASNGTGAASTGSNQTNLSFGRNVKSFYGEFDIPIIGPEMNIPLVEKLEIDLSGRYDDYSDFGVTTNPKLSFSWQVNDWFKLRGNTSTSFVAPVLDLRGVNGNGVFAGNSFGGQTNNVSVSVAAYPLVLQEGISGCNAAVVPLPVTCNVATLQGVARKSGDGNAQPQRGRGWSVGFDVSPDLLPGFSGQVTLWHTTLIGGLTAPKFNNVVNTGSLQSLVTFTPACATSAQLKTLQGAVPLTSPLPPCAQYLFNDINSNYLNLKVDGIDASISYHYDTDGWGTFKFTDSITELLRFKQAYAFGAQGAYYNILNTTGSNTSYPSVQTQMRTNLGWAFDEISVDWFINFTSAYRNWNGSSLNPITFDSNANPSGGGDHVSANITHDAHLSYQFSGGMFGDDEISLSVRNVFNERPPFVNSAGGWDSWVANPLGRITTIGLRAKL